MTAPARSGHERPGQTAWRSYGTRVIHLTGFRVLATILNAVFYAVAARQIGPGPFGVAVSVLSIASVIAPLADFGTTGLLAREGGSGGRLPEAIALARRARIRVLVAIGATSAVAITIGIFQGSLERPLGVVVVALWVGFALIQSYTITRLVIAQRMSAAGAISVIEKGLALGILPVIVLSLPGTAALLVSAITGLAVSSIVGVGLVSKINNSDPDQDNSSNTALKLGTPTPFLITSVGSQLQNLEVPLLQLVAGSRAAGMLGVASRLTGPLALMASTASAVLLAQRSSIASLVPERRRLMSLAAPIGGLAALLLLPVVLLPSSWIITVLGSDFADAAMPIRLVTIGVIVSCLNQPLAALLQSVHAERLVARVIIAGTSVGLLTVALLGSAMGATGAALGVLFAQSVMFFGLLGFGPRATER